MSDEFHSWPPGYRTTLTAVHQGQFDVSRDPAVAFTTVLGSCVSVCLHDPVAQIGGINHYLLVQGADGADPSLKYGVHAMELVINNMLRQGALKDRLKAKIFGGSSINESFASVGARNVSFAQQYLQDEGIEIVSSDTGGTSARRLNFHPVTSKVRMMKTAARAEEQINPKPAAPKRKTAASFLF